jgi:hypothetical protein
LRASVLTGSEMLKTVESVRLKMKRILKDERKKEEETVKEEEIKELLSQVNECD